MAPRSRRAAAASAPVADDEADGSQLSSPGASISPPPEESHRAGLKSNQPLTWRAGKAIPVAELLKRLQKLSFELRDMEQEEDEGAKAVFVPIAKALSSEQLLAHKDLGVRAYTACCAVDVLRLCAPTAPFTPKEVKAVFDMILKSIIPALSDPQNAYNQQHQYVLQSLSEVKSIVLATDLPNAETYIEHLFALFFDILSGSAKNSTGEQLSRQVVINMTSILVVLVDEMESLPQDVVDTIIAQFLRVDSRLSQSGSKSKKGSVTEDRQSTLEIRELPPAYSMSKTICNSCEEKMSREVSKYFSDVIVEATASTRKERSENGDADGADESLSGPSEEDLKELDKAHRLLRELWRAAPSVLQNVVPQLEAELQAEDVRLRLLATETLGDIVSGIGAAGPPPNPAMDPAAYPQAGMDEELEQTLNINLFTIPSSPQSFSQTFPSTWTAFLGRKQDKSPTIRAAWTTAAGRILATSAGGSGLGNKEARSLLDDLARMLNDSDEKVRLAGVKTTATFSLRDIISKLGEAGGVDKEGSILANLAERVKDRKTTVREEAMMSLGRIWGVASGQLFKEDSLVQDIIGGAASKILNAFYTNDPEIQVSIDKVLFETLLPITYPPIKSKSLKATANSSQRIQDSQGGSEGDERKKEPDEIRAERVLVFIKCLDERARKVFFSICGRQVVVSKYMLAFVQASDAYNGGVMDKDEEAIKARLTKLINEISKFLPDHSAAAADLWKFAKAHDRRYYTLLRYTMGPENEYKSVVNAIKEFKKRMHDSNLALMDTFTPLVYRSSNFIYNRSHIPTYMAYARDDAGSLTSTAHSVLSEISQRKPEVLKANVKDICLNLQDEAPSRTRPNHPGSVQTLKTCAAFAMKYKDEIPRDQKFVQAMTNFALYGTPPEAAKHAITILMASSERREMLAADMLEKCITGFVYGETGFLSRLGALSRLCLLAPSQVDDHAEAIIDIAVNEILLKTRNSSAARTEGYIWSDDIDDECVAKIWALKIIVNRIRSHSNLSTLKDTASPVYSLLEKLVSKEGEISPEKDTPSSQKPRLRLAAARIYLKLSQSRAHEQLLTAKAFQDLAFVAQDTQFKVRGGFLQRLRKYLGRNTLPARFYTIPFLLAYEPEHTFKEETGTWLKSRAVFFASQKVQATSTSTAADTDVKNSVPKATNPLEMAFPRLLSILAHHPDYGSSREELKELARYIIFYLVHVASQENISLIFHVAQHVKTCSDALSLSKSSKSRKSIDSTDITTRLHTLSDLATLTIRAFIDAHGWTFQVLPVRVTLPKSLYKEIDDQSVAQEIAKKAFLPNGVSEDVDRALRGSLRKVGNSSRKRKSMPGESDNVHKKRTKLPTREKKDKAAKRKQRDWDADDDEDEDDEKVENIGAEGKASAADRIRSQLSSSRRQSARTSTANTKYRERDDSEDDKEMEIANENVDMGSYGGGDQEMLDASSADEEAEEAEEVMPISKPRAKEVSKKKTSGTPSRAKTTPKTTPKTNGSSKDAKSSTAKSGETPSKNVAPTRTSGRTTRSRA